jgi:hypothetical protein
VTTVAMGREDGLRRFWPELTISVVWLAGLLLSPLITVSPDIHWQLWIGRHLNAGVPLYDWIMEVNPPLWYWMAQPVSALADGLGLPPERVMVTAVFGLIALALVLSAMVIRDLPPRQRAGMLGAILLGTGLMHLTDFGQREHEALIGIIPYALLIARRADGHAVDWRLALAVGVLATPMVALKHYFILLPVLLELWLIVRRRGWQPFRPETLCLATGAIGYAGAVLVFTPAYVTDMIPILGITYTEFRGSPLMLVVNRLVPVAILAGFYFWHFRHELVGITQALLIVSLAFILSFLLQGKGWSYHVDPAVAALTVSVLSHLALRRWEGSELQFSAKALVGLCLAFAITPVVVAGPYRNAAEERVSGFLETMPDGSTVAPFVTAPAILWPMVIDKNFRLPLRYYHFWMLHAVANADGDLAPRLAQFEEAVRQQTVEDMLCHPPDFLIEDTDSMDGRPFDMLGFFRADPAFAALMGAYREYSRLGRLVAYQRVVPLPAPDGIDCMPIGQGREAP